MAEINDLNITDASNVARWPENMAPSAVNNAGRADEGLLARWHKDTNASLVATGLVNVFAVAANQTISAYYDGLEIAFDANITNTGSATLNVDAVAAATIKKHNDQDLVAGDIEAGQKVVVIYDGTNWQLQTPTARGGSPITTRGDVVRGDASGNEERLAVGSANQVLQSDGTDASWGAVPTATDTVVGGLETATQAEMETATATDKIVTPERQNFHPGMAKAWANFTVAGVINASHNVTSITDNGAGNWTVNLTTAFSSVNYVAIANATPVGTGENKACGVANLAAGSYDVLVEDSGGSPEDPSSGNIHTVAFGDQ